MLLSSGKKNNDPYFLIMSSSQRVIPVLSNKYMLSDMEMRAFGLMNGEVESWLGPRLGDSVRKPRAEDGDPGGVSLKLSSLRLILKSCIFSSGMFAIRAKLFRNLLSSSSARIYYNDPTLTQVAESTIRNRDPNLFKVHYFTDQIGHSFLNIQRFKARVCIHVLKSQ